VSQQQQGNLNKIGNQYATHDDLNALRGEIKNEFKDLRHEFSSAIGALGDRLGRLGGTNWQVVIAGLTVVLVLAGMASSLVAYALASESRARQRGDEVNAQVSSIRSEMADTASERISKAFEQIESMRAEFAQQGRDAMASLVGDKLENIDEDVSKLEAETSLEFKNMDEVLQREMRLLDEMLQREMGLHVARLEALIEVNRKGLAVIQGNRFDAKEGDKMLDRIRKLENKAMGGGG
jgi:hypothetical protein